MYYTKLQVVCDPEFSEILMAEIAEAGFDTDAIHSPNEHYGVKNFLLGIETIAAFYKIFAKA